MLHVRQPAARRRATAYDARMIVTTVVSLKGGVGKTSMVLGLAGAAQATGRRALVIDLDPQANASLVLGADRADFTVNDVLADGRSGVLVDAVQPSSWGAGVDVVPAELALEHRNGDGPGIETALARTMEGLSGYDIVLIDSPPTLGALTVTALAAAQRALIVVEPTLFSLVGAEKMLDAIKVVRRNYNKRHQGRRHRGQQDPAHRRARVPARGARRGLPRAGLVTRGARPGHRRAGAGGVPAGPGLAYAGGRRAVRHLRRLPRPAARTTGPRAVRRRRMRSDTSGPVPLRRSAHQRPLCRWRSLGAAATDGGGSEGTEG